MNLRVLQDLTCSKKNDDQLTVMDRSRQIIHMRGEHCTSTTKFLTP
jgi:hypothetical protein